MPAPPLDLATAARNFLALPRVAVAGVSRRGDTAANVIYRRLRADAWRQTFAVNPQADTVEGDPCFRELAAIPGGVEGVVVATPPSVSAAVVQAAAAQGIVHVWLHRGVGAGSVSEEAVARARELGRVVIPGSCPMMWVEGADPFHRCLRWALRVTGRQPHPISGGGAGGTRGRRGGA
jgi:predicted CoA-binding protein